MKYALVTGSTRGIGKAIAQKLLDEDFCVILNYHSDHQTAHEVLHGYHSKYGNDAVHCIQADLSLMESIDHIFEEIQKICSKLDVMVLNAGATDRSSFENMRYESWQHVFNTNLTVPVFMLQKFICMMDNESSVLFTGSLMGIKPHATSLAYGVTKAAIHATVENLVKFMVPYGIRVNAIAPGFAETDWHKNKPVSIRNNIIKKIALKRFGHTTEIAEAAYAILNNNYINGQVIVIDGGYDYK